MKKLKNDKYRKSRGGHARLLLISCEKCGKGLFEYQKDGPGILKRLYFDRIHSQQEMDKKILSCPDCKEVLGVTMIYKKENRLAYRLYSGAVKKDIKKLNR